MGELCVKLGFAIVLGLIVSDQSVGEAAEDLKIYHFRISGTTLRWSTPAGTNGSYEVWKYKVTVQFPLNGKLVERQLKETSSTYTRLNVTEDGGMYPCTDYLISLTAYSQMRKLNRERYRIRYTLLPGVHRRARATNTLSYSTASTASRDVIKAEDLTMKKTKDSDQRCSVTFSWKPKIRLFGCPTEGLYVKYKTPESWPKWIEAETSGQTVKVSRLPDHMVYPFYLTTYNKVGPNPQGTMVLVTFPEDVPSNPLNVTVNVRTCQSARVTWSKSPMGPQDDVKFRVRYTAPFGLYRYQDTTGTDYSLYNLRNSNYSVTVTALTSWGESEGETIRFNPYKSGLDCQ